MTQPRTKTIPGYQIEHHLEYTPLGFPYFGAVILDAHFSEYQGQPCVEAIVRIGMVQDPYTLVLTITQAREANIIEVA